MPKYQITFWPGSAQCQKGGNHKSCGHPERKVQGLFDSWELANRWSATRHSGTSDGALIERIPTEPLKKYLAILFSPNRTEYQWTEAEDYLHVQEILKSKQDYRTVMISLDPEDVEDLKRVLREEEEVGEESE